MKKYIFFGAVLLLPAVRLTAIRGILHAAPAAGYYSRSALSYYRDGDHKKALRSILDYASSDPENRERKRSAVKLLLEMADESHRSGRGAEALELLKGARTLEDNEAAKELYRTIVEERASAREAVQPGAGPDSFTVAAHGNASSINDWFRTLEGPGPEASLTGTKQAEAGRAASPEAGAMPPRRTPNASFQPVRRGASAAAGRTGSGAALPVIPAVKPGSAAANSPGVSMRALLSISALIFSVFAILAGAAALYLKRQHERFRLESELKIQKAYQDLAGEKAR
ncbi:MAG TPA: hypothetical protein PL037_08850, partial [Elusimicrobiales bacterium]|nr:hypothetical protein [Elusimicrobiales bacterium]